ncbi:MAG: WG repeat-containing protein [Candidatus Paraprevotella stercoravium]|uniref:WG repeat-containing protein n=1 Tax=Candidatus Paraprevotella stercoravium TaxID=2838725 RepID=A0A9E2L4S4_9BACT|nr:WG repeat-containing protein [Candidatus Paraprevotella stercoravium]
MKNIVEKNYGEVTVVENSDYKWGVIDSKGNEIVKFGKYDWIEGFEQGLCRVKIGKQSSNLANNDNKWGIINENGEEVLPCVYDDNSPLKIR